MLFVIGKNRLTEENGDGLEDSEDEVEVFIPGKKSQSNIFVTSDTYHVSPYRAVAHTATKYSTVK